jgi:hypothetical protein
VHNSLLKEAQMPFAAVKVTPKQDIARQSELKIRLPTGVMLIIDRETDKDQLREILSILGAIG